MTMLCGGYWHHSLISVKGNVIPKSRQHSPLQRPLAVISGYQDQALSDWIGRESELHFQWSTKQKWMYRITSLNCLKSSMNFWHNQLLWRLTAAQRDGVSSPHQSPRTSPSVMPSVWVTLPPFEILCNIVLYFSYLPTEVHLQRMSWNWLLVSITATMWLADVFLDSTVTKQTICSCREGAGLPPLLWCLW